MNNNTLAARRLQLYAIKNGWYQIAADHKPQTRPGYDGTYGTSGELKNNPRAENDFSK